VNTPKTQSAESFVVQRYEQLWGRWDQSRYRYKHVKGARIARIIEQTGGFAPRTLEVGVGPGGIAVAISRRGTKVIGIDLSPTALRNASEHCRGESVSLLRGSAFSLPFQDHSLPLVYASQVLHLFDAAGRRAIMDEAYRVLQPGGRFIFDMKNAASHLLHVVRYKTERRQRNFPPQSEILDLLATTGFQAVSRWPGVLPVVGWSNVPNTAFMRRLSHTTFFVATRPSS
jgi:ubiquinone/menaquinone biosynthesis C-methylase UbiE